MLSQRFKVLTSLTLGFVTNKTYLSDHAQCFWLMTHYMQAIMRHKIGYNINNISNHLSFAYWRLVPELLILVLLFIKSTKAIKFIHILEKKQEIWFEMMTIDMSCWHGYYCLQIAYCPSKFNSHLLLVTLVRRLCLSSSSAKPLPWLLLKCFCWYLQTARLAQLVSALLANILALNAIISP